MYKVEIMVTKKTSAANSSSKENQRAPSIEITKERSSGCCKGTSNCSSPAVMDLPRSATPAIKNGSTRIIIKYDVGFNNALFIRGKGANLNWEKGIPLKNVKRDEWVWETNAPFATCEFKILINDSQYELGENHQLSHGATAHHTPKF